MSSLLSTGVKKNKKTFAPTAGRRKDRNKSAGSKPTNSVSESQPPVPPLTQSTDASQSSQSQSQLATQDVHTVIDSTTVLPAPAKKAVSFTIPATSSTPVNQPTTVKTSSTVVIPSPSVVISRPTVVKPSSTASKPSPAVSKSIPTVEHAEPIERRVSVSDTDARTKSEPIDETDITDMLTQREQFLMPKVESPKPSVENIEAEAAIDDIDNDEDYRPDEEDEAEQIDQVGDDGDEDYSPRAVKKRPRKQRKVIAKKAAPIRKPIQPRRPPAIETVEIPPTRLRPQRAPTVAVGVPIVASSSGSRINDDEEAPEAKSDSDDSYSGSEDSYDIDMDEIDDLESLQHGEQLEAFLERRRRRKAARSQSAAGRKGRGRRKKNQIPDVDSLKTLEDLTNDETPIKESHLEKPMSYFTKDIDGIVSKTFKEMEIARLEEMKKKEEYLTMTAEEVEELRRKEEEEKRLVEERKAAERAAAEEERRRREAERPVLTESSNAVQVRIINGEIVLDTDTLVVEREQGNGGSFDGEAMEIVEETSMTRKVNSTTHGKRERSSKWDELETEAFYDLLSQFGTDFNTIAKMMPGRTRNQIRSKFNKEERVNPWKVTEYLVRKKKPVDIDKFKEVVGELDAVPDDFNSMELA